MKTLANVSKLGFRTLLFHLVKLGGSEKAVERIDSKVLDKIKAKRINHKGALNTLADTIDIPLDTAELLLLELGCTVERAKFIQKDRVRSVATEQTPRRAPIVVVMGHVDHGKTTLLDSLRNTNVVAKEHGGITQAIAGFKINYKNYPVCFMDTPGHEAFSLMRRSGTAVTDLAVIVIACTEGVMPQTIESVKYARDAKLPVVFALTKSDLMPEFDEGAIIDQLNMHSLYEPDSDMFVPVVATKKQGLDELMEAIQLAVESDPLRSRSVKKSLGEAVVLESRVDKSLGMVADVVVRWGTFQVGDAVVCGDQFGKIRRMLNSEGEVVKVADASTPVRLCGPFERCPLPGLDVLAVKDDKTAKAVVEHRQDVARQEQQREARVRQLLGRSSSRPAEAGKPGYIKFIPKRKTRKEKRAGRKLKEDAFDLWQSKEEERRSKEFRCILKADSEGSLHALQFAIAQAKEKNLVPQGHELVVVRKSVGHLTEQDVALAKSTGATILGFNLKVTNQLAKAVKNDNVQVLNHTIIYHLVEEYVKKLEEAKLLEDKESEADKDEVEGECQVLKVFQITGKEKRQVAGCRVTSGTLNKARMFVVMRDGEPVSEPRTIESMKILKEDASSVEKGLECGIALKGFAAFQEGDVIQCVRQSVK